MEVLLKRELLLPSCDHAFFIRTLPARNSSTPHSPISYRFTHEGIVFPFLFTERLLVFQTSGTSYSQKQDQKEKKSVCSFHQHALGFLVCAEGSDNLFLHQLPSGIFLQLKLWTQPFHKSESEGFEHNPLYNFVGTHFDTGDYSQIWYRSFAIFSP